MPYPTTNNAEGLTRDAVTIMIQGAERRLEARQDIKHTENIERLNAIELHLARMSGAREWTRWILPIAVTALGVLNEVLHK